jgi:competence protein ComEC
MLLPRGFPARWIGAIALLPVFLVLPLLPAQGALRLTVLDVGQGLAIVAQTNTHALLFDAGPAYGPQVDSGNRIVVPYLRASGVQTLSGMVISHGDNDHSGGAFGSAGNSGRLASDFIARRPRAKFIGRAHPQV